MFESPKKKSFSNGSYKPIASKLYSEYINFEFVFIWFALWWTKEWSKEGIREICMESDDSDYGDIYRVLTG